jgi:hypothetical protein
MSGSVRLFWALCALALVASPASAQLRPVGPLDWELLTTPRTLNIAFGVGYILDQHASLAGTRGNLLELGNFQMAWRSGRISVEIAGTLRRRFEDDSVVRPPILGTDPPNGEVRTDAGDILASTLVRLTGSTQPVLLAVRFGTRLPTTSNEPGLDRDRTDFFASVGARYGVGPFAISGETGVGILSTRIDGVDQLDVLTYSGAIEYRFGRVVASSTIVGQDDMHSRVIRGNEDLSELRFGVRAGERLWLSAFAIKGLADFSPGTGVLLMAGFRR